MAVGGQTTIASANKFKTQWATKFPVFVAVSQRVRAPITAMSVVMRFRKRVVLQ